MNDIKIAIIDLLNRHGAKSFTHVVKTDPVIMAELSPLLDLSKTLSQVCYDYVNEPDTLCGNGNQLKFKSYVEGYKFCGRAGVCKCAKDAVSKSVSSTKALATKAEKKVTNALRSTTNLTKYGVANIGTTQQAKDARALTASDPIKMVLARDRYKDTMLGKHGVDNGFKLNKVNLVRESGEFAQTDTAKQTRTKTRKERKIADPLYFLGTNFKNLKEKLLTNDLALLLPIEKYTGVNDKHAWPFECNTCGYTWDQRYWNISKTKCAVCNPTQLTYKSKPELEIFEYIKSIYSGMVISGDRRIINPFEVDILLPDLKIGIEHNGLYFHSENSNGRGYSYHKNKMDLLKKKNYRLISIFGDEWQFNEDLVKSKLKNILGLDENSVYARKTTVVQIPRDIAIPFINEHHIQGAPRNLPINYGLMLDDELIAIMSFSGDATEYNLTRFCSSVRIVGGASKLLSAFIEDYDPSSIISYADLRWSQGDLYPQLGFTVDTVIQPTPDYVEKYTHRIHSETVHNRIGVCAGVTKWQAAQEIGYDRIWNCGKIRYIWKSQR